MYKLIRGINDEYSSLKNGFFSIILEVNSKKYTIAIAEEFIEDNKFEADMREAENGEKNTLTDKVFNYLLTFMGDEEFMKRERENRIIVVKNESVTKI